MGKMPDMGLEHHIKMDYVQNLRKTLSKPKLGPQNILYDISWPFLRRSRDLEFAVFG
tara:strand:- start:198 stop:368 length:171 start_codon:yes stop_codon:yes gene_type:complete